jgi:hypothetical protein
VTPLLSTLPSDHPLRNTPLGQIGAEYQWVNTKLPEQWHRVTKGATIARNTFNELAANWTESYRWRAEG